MDQNLTTNEGMAPSRSELKRGRAEQAIRRQQMKTRLGILAIAAGAILLVGGGIWALVAANRNLPGVLYESQGQQHVDLNYAFDYNSNPPTSGPHYGSPANWGIYDYEANDKFFIHNLEHGGIWISYKPGIPPQVVEDLKSIVNEFGGSKLVMNPRSANDADIAAAAWTRLLKFNLENGKLSDAQKEEIRTFYRKLKNHGPELVPDNMSGVDPKSMRK